MRLTAMHRKVGLIQFASPLLFGGCECGSKTPSGRSDGAANQTAQPQKPREPLVKKVEIADWCPEHGVPESICTRCNASLIQDFKKKGIGAPGTVCPNHSASSAILG